MKPVNINVNFSEILGKIKPMHSVNNGPVGGRAHASGDSNAHLFTEAAIPYARNHDANFWGCYGAPHTVDIIAIFPNFDADENDPESYDFHLTDEYNKKIADTGTKVFYRLGNKIEHESKKYGAIPPKDFHKFARICEHIIRHMNEGWADGTHLGIEYWEIWNEPDYYPACWKGKQEGYFELYDVTARHLKKCFPNLKIGGPAVTRSTNERFLKPFFEYLTKDKNDPAPMDFFSFHWYGTDPKEIAEHCEIARKLLDKYRYFNTETILNEWNYVRGWDSGAVMLYNKKVIPSLKGSAFITSTMISCHKTPLDHLMYYDASMPSMWNGLFDRDTYKPLKPYHALYCFSRLYLLGNEIKCDCDTEKVYSLSAISDDKKEAAILVSHYADLEPIDSKGCETEIKTVRIDWSDFTSENGIKVTYSIIDDEKDAEVVSEEIFFGDKGAHILKVPMYTTILITLSKL